MFSRLVTTFSAAVVAGAVLVGVMGAATPVLAQDYTLYNVSYDPTRELYVQINKAFTASYKKETGDTVTVQNSHGGSGKQARGVIDGSQADVVTLALAADIDAIAKAGLLPETWQARLPENSTPYTSTIVFLVRKGNAKGIKDWGDLVKDNVKVITPDPKASGGARWAYLAAYGWALKQNAGADAGGADAKAKAFVAELYKHVPILDSGARASTVTFAQKNQGDVLLAWENEAYLALDEFGDDKFEIVAPKVSILAEPPVAVVDKNAEKDGVAKVSEAYLKYLYTPAAQEIIAQNHYRPRNVEVAAKHSGEFATIELFTIYEVFGGWKKRAGDAFRGWRRVRSDL